MTNYDGSGSGVYVDYIQRRVRITFTRAHTDVSGSERYKCGYYYRVTRFSLSPFFGSVQFHCCGVHNYTDWKDTKYFSTQGIPATCCKDPMNCKPETLKNLEQAADEVYQTVSVDRRHFLSFTI